MWQKNRNNNLKKKKGAQKNRINYNEYNCKKKDIGQDEARSPPDPYVMVNGWCKNI